MCEHPVIVGLCDSETGEIVALGCTVCGEELDPSEVMGTVSRQAQEATRNRAVAMWN